MQLGINLVGRAFAMLVAAATLSSASIAAASGGQVSAPVTSPAPVTATASQGAAAAQWWSYQPVKSQAVPQVHNNKWVRTPIDAFVLARLEANNIQPSADADSRDVHHARHAGRLGNDPNAGGREGLCFRSLAPRRTRSSSIDCWLRRITESVGGAVGSILRAMLTVTATTQTALGRTCGAIVTT